ncbi:MAG: hypothetical protein PWR30_475 [Candidatus Woesearchaeota archaeon]|nr:hypothetical protein [Candidatus Woesearchaeota archaeon]
MILGKIVGKVSTTEFSFLVKNEQASKKYEFVQLVGADNKYYLCQIVELERDSEKTIAKCRIIGYKDKDSGRIIQPRIPFKPGTEVLLASEDFIKEIILINKPERGAFIGFLEDKKIPVILDLNKILTKHLAILAKSGAGKSYTAGVIAEEILEKGIPMLIFDPHGEYASLKEPNPSKEDEKELSSYGLTPKGYADCLIEYGNKELIEGALPILIKGEFSANELIRILPSKITTGQQALLYSAIKDMDSVNLNELMFSIENEENPLKYQLLGILNALRNSSIFSDEGMEYSELIKKGQASLINLKGYSPNIQQVIVYIIAKKLFELRKRGKISPFFMLIEEAHNFCPERSFGEAISSPIIRTIASEGRKFGIGLCIITQRPARVDKNVLSQCSTQILMKITNPNDLKAISNSVEGITYETEASLMNLPIGSALISGFVDVPLIVDIRKRRTRHGGEAEKILEEIANDETEGFIEKEESYIEEGKWLIMPKISKKEIQLMSKKKIERIETILFPALFLLIEGHDGKKIGLVFDLVSGAQITDLDKKKSTKEFTTESQNFKPVYEKIESDKIFEAEISVDEIIDKFNNAKIANRILEKRKCYCVTYKPIYKE